MFSRNRFVKVFLASSLSVIALFAVGAWIEYSVVPTNLAIARDAMSSIEQEYKNTGDYVNSVAQAESKNCWGQPVKILVVKVGWPVNAIDVTVISPGPLGIIGVASVTKVIEAD